MVPTHADFHDRQVLVGEEAGPVLLDFDDAAMGEAAHDIGAFLSHLDEHARAERIDRATADRLVDAFLTGYGEVPPEIPFYRGLVTARLAARPLRNLLPDWEDQTELRLRHALRHLDPATT